MFRQLVCGRGTQCMPLHFGDDHPVAPRCERHVPHRCIARVVRPCWAPLRVCHNVLALHDATLRAVPYRWRRSLVMQHRWVSERCLSNCIALTCSFASRTSVTQSSPIVRHVIAFSVRAVVPCCVDPACMDGSVYNIVCATVVDSSPGESAGERVGESVG